MRSYIRIDQENSKPKIDAKDQKILDLLVKDARATASSIAKKAALSRDAVAYRIKRLEQKKVILGYSPFIDYRKLGYFKMMLYLLVSEKSEERRSSLVSYLKSHPKVTRTLEFNDRWDFQVGVIAKNIDEFNEFLQELHQNFGDIIMEEEQLIVLERLASTNLPKPFYTKEATGPAQYEIDGKDLQILGALALDARTPNFTIGEKLGIDADTVRNRIRKMKSCGIINRISAVVSISRLGYSFYVFVANLRYLGSRESTRLRSIVEENKNVLEIHKTLGNSNVLMYLAVEDAHILNSILKDFKRQFAHPISNYLTLVTYQERLFKPVPEAITGKLQR